MLFTEVRFALLVAACWVSFVSVPGALRPHVLAAGGAVFYALYAPAAAPVVFGLVLAVYVIPPRGSAIALGLTLAILAYYKLATGSPTTAALAATNLAGGQPLLMPLGLSFLAFELMHVAIERRRGRIDALKLADYLAYALYFPCRVAGPIRRYPDFHRSLANAKPAAGDVYTGLTRVLVGVAKKVVLADPLGLTVAEIAYAATPLHVAKVLVAYAFELYLDFSAYSDMAIGISRAFGIVVPENFNFPYLSESIQEFWTRWHISLSSWVRAYIFLPLGRRAFATRLRSKPLAIATIAYLVSFLAIGAWHGATANFLVWGAYHGALLGGHHVYRKTLAERLAVHPFYQSWPARALSVGLTFAAVTAGWILFLTPNLDEAARLVRLLVGRP